MQYTLCRVEVPHIPARSELLSFLNDDACSALMIMEAVVLGMQYVL